jgi:hypothetical protein
LANYRLFPSTNGPSAATSFSGSFSGATAFHVTADGTYLAGYWWWVCSTGSPPTGPQKLCLWQDTGSAAGHVVPAATITSGTLSAGWNYIPLLTPVPLSKDGAYRAVIGVNGPFPFTTGQYGSGQSLTAGITNGPLKAYSDTGGTAPNPYNNPQCSFQTSNADPAGTTFPASGNGSYNGWTDVQVQDTAPPGATFRLWPNYTPPAGLNSQTTDYTLAIEIVLSAACTLNNIWFFSPSGATVLPTRCAIWDESTGLVVPGTDNTAPTWSGAAGSGWISCAYSGVTLPAGHYRPSVFNTGGSQWFGVITGYFVSGGAGANGISTGPLTAPNNTNATAPGQAVYNPAGWAYPNTWSSAGNGESYWVDVEVKPVVAPTENSGSFMVFFS